MGNLSLLQMVGVIKRNFKYLSISSFVLVYKSSVSLHLDYCNSVDTYSKSDIETFEKVQKKATKMIPVRNRNGPPSQRTAIAKNGPYDDV